MGAGSFNEGEITLLFPGDDQPEQTHEIGVFTVVAVAEPGYSLNLDDLFGDAQFSIQASGWIQALKGLQDGLLQATHVQLGIRVYLSDDGWGLGQAEFVLHEEASSPAYATHGEFGRFGEAVHIFGAATRRDTMVHEFGHHAWGLGDEYTAPVLSDPIDSEADAILDPAGSPDYTKIPLAEAANDPQDLENAEAILKFDQRLERLRVVSYELFATPPTVTVETAFTQDPRTADPKFVFYQRPIGFGCSDDANANHSIMEAKGVGGGALKTEFCVEENHDQQDGDTQHTARYADEELDDKSCWGVIRHVMDKRFDFQIEPPLESGVPVNIFVPDDALEVLPLVKEARVVLVMDRSGSMGSAGKIQGARVGIEYWLSSLARSNEDYLSLLWYNEELHEQLALDQYDLDGDDDDIVGNLQTIQPQGFTNILGALEAARDQINSRAGRAAVQAVVLLTDGIHNRPVGTVATDVISEFQQDGIQIISVALGGPEQVDYETLDKLSQDTGGNVIRVDGGGSPAITAGLSEAEGVLRNGIVATDEVEVAPAPKEAQAAAESSKLLDITEFIKLYGFDSLSTLLSDPPPGVAVVPFQLEEGAQRAKFSLAYPTGQKLLLYLVDPDGTIAEFDGDDISLINPASPFTLAIVNKPKAGWWRALVFGVRGASPVTAHYVAFSENRSVVVSGGCDPVVELGNSVALWSGATFGDRLSGLYVRADIVSPNGVVSSITLSDATADDIGTGAYLGRFVPAVAGPHRCRFTLVCNGKAVRAGAIHRALHASQKDDKIALAVKAPRFRRTVNSYFDVGSRPTPKDADRRRPPPRHCSDKSERLDLKRFWERLAEIGKSKS